MRSLSLPSSELRANVLEALVSIIEVEDSTTNVAIQSQAKTLVTLLLGVAIDLDPKRSSEVSTMHDTERDSILMSTYRIGTIRGHE